MSQEKQQVGRLALRVEGDWWVAYYAMPFTMEGAIELGRVLLVLVKKSDRKQTFMDLMSDSVSEFLQSITGAVPNFEVRTAPEHERAGRA